MDEAAKVGVLALQGNFGEHVMRLRQVIAEVPRFKGLNVVEVRSEDDFDHLLGLVIPGVNISLIHNADNSEENSSLMIIHLRARARVCASSCKSFIWGMSSRLSSQFSIPSM